MNKNLGKRGRDKVTGFEGIIVSKVYYITGCNQYGITPRAIDNKVPETQYFDVARIEIVGAGVQVEEVLDEEHPGGPNRDQPNR